MDPKMQKDIISITSEALMKSEDQTSIADEITNSLNSKYGRLWYAIISFGHHEFGLDKTSLNNSLKSPDSIIFVLGQIRFFVYKMFQPSNDELIIKQARNSPPVVLNKQMVNFFNMIQCDSNLVLKYVYFLINSRV